LIAGPCGHSSTPRRPGRVEGMRTGMMPRVGDMAILLSISHGILCVLDTRSNLRGDSVLETSDQLRAPRAILGGQASVPGFQVMSAPAFDPRPVAAWQVAGVRRLTPTPGNKIQAAEIRRAEGRLVSSAFAYGVLFNSFDGCGRYCSRDVCFLQPSSQSRHPSALPAWGVSRCGEQICF